MTTQNIKSEEERRADLEEARQIILDKAVREFVNLIVLMGMSGFKADELIKSVNAITGKDESNIQNLLIDFYNLSSKQKTEIISICGEKKTQREIDNILNGDFNESLFENICLDLNDDDDLLESFLSMEKTEILKDQLKKQIKYCKNPLEKQKLQRELSRIGFNSSKHRKNNKHRRKK